LNLQDWNALQETQRPVVEQGARLAEVALVVAQMKRVLRVAMHLAAPQDIKGADVAVILRSLSS